MIQDAIQAIAVVDMNGLSYEAYFKKINQLIGQLRDNWKQEQRVKTLKVAIQLSKLLADSTQARLYTKKHRMITDSLDEFGRLVHERVHSIARNKIQSGPSTSSSTTHTYDGHQKVQGDVVNNKLALDEAHELASKQLEQAKDVGRNWFLKVASIRELVPRFYIELAIMKAGDILFASPMMTPSSSCRLENQYFFQSLKRLTKIAWGFGDPIVAMHARLYLCQVANRLFDRELSLGPSLESSRGMFSSEVITNNLNCCATLVRKLDVELLVETSRNQSEAASCLDATSFSRVSSQGGGDGGSLGFELISSPIATILYSLAAKFEDAIQERLEQVNVQVEGQQQHQQRLEHCLQDLLDKLALGEHEDCAFRRNVILSAICKALPNELVPPWGRRLMYELRVGYDKWRHELGADGDRYKLGVDDQQTDNLATSEPVGEQSPRERLAQATISSFYTALTSLMIALDGCEQSTLQLDDRTNTNDADPQPMDPIQLLSSGELILNKLATFQQPVDPHDHADHLKCFKALLTYANHCSNAEAAVDRLLRDYLGRFGPRKHNKSDLYIRQQQQHNQEAINLLDIIKTLFTSRTNLAEFERILALSSFQRLFDCIRKDEHKLDASKWILESMRANIKLNHNHRGHNHVEAYEEANKLHQQSASIRSRTMINFLLKLFNTINETLSPLADQDELEHLGELVVFYLDLISFQNNDQDHHHQDVQEQAEFYLRCRSCVGNLPMVLEYLIRRVLEQPAQHRLVERKRAARQNFLNGCLAFAFSTIPALHDNLVGQLELYQLGCKLALERSSLSLADYYLKQMVATVANLLRPTEDCTNNDLGHSTIKDPLKQSASLSSELERSLAHLLDLVLKHQDHIDLKHKLALSELIRSSFARSSSSLLLQSLKHLNCIERLHNDDNLNNDNNDD